MNPEISAHFFAHLYDKIGMPSRIFGPVTPAIRLAERFAKASDCKHAIHSMWRVHRLDKSKAQEIKVSGHVVLGTKDDRQIVSNWGKEYNLEKPANVNIERFLLRKLEDGHLYLWVDGDPKSLATLSGTFCTGPRISSVFTPRILRGSGYAFALVYNLGNSQLTSGSAYITLNTLAGDAVENMYRKIGYSVIGERASVVFRRNVLISRPE
jgi:predicted GNAT family acetyltransferase